MHARMHDEAVCVWLIFFSFWDLFEGSCWGCTAIYIDFSLSRPWMLFVFGKWSWDVNVVHYVGLFSLLE